MPSGQIICLGASVRSSAYPASSWDYLASFPSLISIQELWAEMDRVWEDCLRKHCKKFTNAFFAEYYTHPVWCLNSIFSEVDPASIHNREALIEAIEPLGVNSIVDMGGGYGVFLRMLKKRIPYTKVILCEPYISEEIETELRKNDILTTKQAPAGEDAYIFLDVLEHLTNPLSYLDGILSAARSNSYFIFGNCFYPFIKCHLAGTFYLRHTFVIAARLMGLRYIRDVEGAEYIQIYRLEAKSDINPQIAALVAKVAAFLLVPIRLLIGVARKAKRIARKLVLVLFGRGT